MGRNLPMEEITTFHQPTIVSILLIVIWMAVLVSTISGLCGLWSKKISGNSSSDDKKEGDAETTDPLQPPPQAQMGVAESNSNEDDQFSTRPLPPPPSAIKLELGDIATGKVKPKIDKTSSLQNYMSKTTSRKRLTSSISMKMSMKIKDKASEFKGKASELKDKASDLTDLRKKNENESLWQKRIILGEKCRLPNHDDEDEVITYDEQGNKVVAGTQTQTRPRQGLARSCSSIVVSSTVATSEEKGEEKGKGKEKDYDSDSDCDV
ncbi:hypothetical protein vseg_002653 [Gypsophila vaccaria]